MPIEIVELVVKATVSQNDRQDQSANNTAGKGTHEQTSERESIIKEAVDIVMEILRQERER